MPCPEYFRLAALSENKRQAYTYIRLNEKKVRFSKEHYNDLVKEGFDALTAALKDVGWHKMHCAKCRLLAAK